MTSTPYFRLPEDVLGKRTKDFLGANIVAGKGRAAIQARENLKTAKVEEASTILDAYYNAYPKHDGAFPQECVVTTSSSSQLLDAAWQAVGTKGCATVVAPIDIKRLNEWSDGPGDGPSTVGARALRRTTGPIVLCNPGNVKGADGKPLESLISQMRTTKPREVVADLGPTLTIFDQKGVLYTSNEQMWVGCVLVAAVFLPKIKGKDGKPVKATAAQVRSVVRPILAGVAHAALKHVGSGRRDILTIVVPSFGYDDFQVAADYSNELQALGVERCNCRLVIAAGRSADGPYGWFKAEPYRIAVEPIATSVPVTETRQESAETVEVPDEEPEEPQSAPVSNPERGGGLNPTAEPFSAPVESAVPAPAAVAFIDPVVEARNRVAQITNLLNGAIQSKASPVTIAAIMADREAAITALMNSLPSAFPSTLSSN